MRKVLGKKLKKMEKRDSINGLKKIYMIKLDELLTKRNNASR
jgi:hypothetical protein